MSLAADICYAALTERNADFDGVFFVGVRTTGVFCRPTCPARPRKRETELRSTNSDAPWRRSG